MDSSGLSVDNSGLDMDLDTDKSGSNIMTMEPFSSPVMGRSKEMSKLKSRGTNSNKNDRRKMEILPGLYEIVSYNKFLILQLEDDVFQNISVFKATREIVNACGSEPKIRPQDDGTLLLEVSSPEQSENLLKMNSLVGRKVRCFPHPFHNQCRGVIYAPELIQLDTEEIQQELEDQNVMKVVRMRKKVGDQMVPLATLILTFKTYRLPNIIKAGWLKFKVKPYIPSPLRCFHCQMFGHSVQKCKRRMSNESAICSNCGKHSHGNCNESASCVNCGEAHPSTSKNCSKFLLEKEVQTIKVLEKISFKDARKKALEKQIRPGITFASVIKMYKPNKQSSTADEVLPLPAASDEVQQPPPPTADEVKQPPPPPAADVAQQPLAVVATKMNKNETASGKHAADKPLDQGQKPGSSLTSNQNKKSDHQSKPKNAGKSPTTPAKAQANANGAKSKANSANSNSRNKKRERTPEMKIDKSGTDSDEPSSQNSIVLQRNIPKLKRAKDKH